MRKEQCLRFFYKNQDEIQKKKQFGVILEKDILFGEKKFSKE